MATDFTYGGKQIVSGGPFKPNEKDMPNDARERVNCYADIATIPNPYVGLKITVKVDETNNNKMTDYIVKSLKANSIGVANSLIDEVEKYVDYLGVSGASGEGLTSEQAQQLQTAYLHSQSTHVQASDIPTKTSDLTNDSGFLTSIPSEYITDSEMSLALSTKANTSDIPSLNGYATETFVTNKIAEASLSGGEVDLSGYATKDDLTSKVDKVEGKSLSTNDLTNELKSNYDEAYLHSQSTHVQSSDIPTKVSDLQNDSGFITAIPDEYVTETELEAKGYLTSHQDISGLQTKTDNTLNTIDKTVVGAINELKDGLDNVGASGGGSVDLSAYYTKSEIDAFRPLVKTIANNVWTLVTLEDGTETYKNVLTHNLGTNNLTVSFYDSDLENLYCSYKCTDENNITITNDEAIAMTVVIFHGGINTSISTSGTGTGTSYANQTWTFIGDSITYGIGTTKTYHQYLKEKLELGSTINLGVNGKTLSPTMANDIETASTITNAVFVFGGTNDFYGNVPLGEYYTTDESGTRTLNTDTSTYRGALISICQTMYSRFPDAMHILMTPIHRELYKGGQLTDLQKNNNGNYLEEYVQSVIEVGKLMSVKVIDLYSQSGLQPNIAENKAKFFSYDDGLHPIAAGHEKICDCIIANL